MSIEKERDSQPYATNLLIVKVGLDPATGLQHPGEADIEAAKERVDANEK